MKNEALKQALINRCDIVGSTYGPNGEGVLIDDPRNPYFTQDGFTVLEAMEKHDKSLAARLLVDAARMVAYRAGDGTTTCALLIRYALSDDIDLSLHLDDFIAHIKSISQEAGQGEVIKSAITAAKDEQIGTEIGKLVWELGPDGHVKSQAGLRFRAYSRPGYEMEGGPLLPQFLGATGPGIVKHVASLSLFNPLVVIINHTLTDQRQLQAIYKAWQQYGDNEGNLPPLVIIAGDVDAKPLQNVAVNLLRNNKPVFIIQPPPIKDLKLRWEILKDLQYVCNCDVIYEKSSGSVIDRTGNGFTGQFGQVDSIDLEEGLARFSGDPVRVTDRKRQVRKEKGDEDTKKLRLSLLSGASGVVEVGAGTIAESQHINLAVEDAVRASQGVLREGYVNGGPKFWEGVAEAVPELYLLCQHLWERLPNGTSVDSADAMIKAFESAASLVHQLRNVNYVISKEY